MLDSERTFKIKVRSPWTVFQISLSSAVICIERVSHRIEIVQYLQNYKRLEVDQDFLESSYRVLEVTSKWKTLKQPNYLLRSVEFWPTFDIQTAITLAIFWEKLQNYTF